MVLPSVEPAPSKENELLDWFKNQMMRQSRGLLAPIGIIGSRSGASGTALSPIAGGVIKSTPSSGPESTRQYADHCRQESPFENYTLNLKCITSPSCTT